MNTDSTFPNELRQKSTEDKLMYFKQLIIPHPILRAAHRDLLNKIRPPVLQSNLCYVFGPIGVGKTTLLQSVKRRIIRDEQNEMKSDPGYIPMVSIEVVPPNFGKRFDWDDVYRRILLTMNEPLVDHKILPPSLMKKPIQETGGRLRYGLEKCLQHRRTRTIFFDEAQHLNKISGGQGLLAQMDILKSLASTTQTTLVLVGTYELLDCWDLSAQMNRRSDENEFRRYKPDDDKDQKNFRWVLQIFQQHLPLHRPPDLVNQWEFCYERSAGCVGILKGWLYRSLKMALDQDKKTITQKILEQTAMPSIKLKRIVRELCEGEQRLLGAPNDDIQLREMLGFSEPNISPNTADNTDSGTKKPFERNLGRDKTLV